MATVMVNGTTVSAPHIGASAAESGGIGGLHNDLCAAALAMDLRQPLQVIVSTHDVLARRLRGGAAPGRGHLLVPKLVERSSMSSLFGR
jgi:hypothetical protein